jgi:two-component system chemotaxis sensor kinase CheA
MGDVLGKGVEDMGDDKEIIGDMLSDDPEIRSSFVAEAKEALDAVEDDFLHLEKQKDNPDPTLLDKVFRAIHSVKGAAGFLGLGNMATLALVMETLLSGMRAGKIRPESKYIDALLAGVYLLAAMLDDINHSSEVDITSVHDRLSSLLGLNAKSCTD